MKLAFACDFTGWLKFGPFEIVASMEIAQLSGSYGGGDVRIGHGGTVAIRRFDGRLKRDGIKR